MAQCRKCGKKGFFLRLDKNSLCDSCIESIRQQTLEKARESERKLEETKRKQQAVDRIVDEQLKRLNNAREEYEKTEEYDKLIAVYEDVFSTPTQWNAASHKLRLVGYYQKCKQWDKAWALLNAILLDYPNEVFRVRRSQYRQLKDEKKYTEALKMYLLYKYNDCKSITCWSDVKEREYDSFLKEAQSLVKKAKLDINAVPELADIFIELVESPRSSEATALKKFKAWYGKLENVG